MVAFIWCFLKGVNIRYFHKKTAYIISRLSRCEPFIYRELVQNVKFLIEFLVPDSPFRITIVNKAFEMAFPAAQCGHIVDDANN
jgi:hypothetical protein